MVSILALGVFVGFVLAGLGVRRAEAHGPEAVRRRVMFLVNYVVVVTAVVALSRRDLWPFSSWQLMVGDAPAAVGASPDPISVRILAYTEDGQEYPVDYRAWQPLSIEDLSAWLGRHLERRAPEQRARALAYLLDRAEEGRRRVLQGERPGSFERVFGDVSAPYHLLHPRRWRVPSDVPAGRFVGIRVYTEHYDLEGRRAGDPIQMKLLFDSRGGEQ